MLASHWLYSANHSCCEPDRFLNGWLYLYICLLKTTKKNLVFVNLNCYTLTLNCIPYKTIVKLAMYGLLKFLVINAYGKIFFCVWLLKVDGGNEAALPPVHLQYAVSIYLYIPILISQLNCFFLSPTATLKGRFNLLLLLIFGNRLRKVKHTCVLNRTSFHKCIETMLCWRY